MGFNAEHMVLWLLAALITAALCEFIVRFPHALTRLDAVVRHSSHAAPTPRGGGLGIVLGMLAVLLMLYFDGESTRHAVLARHAGLALALVGGVGFIDDVRGLPIWPRLAAHTLAALLAVALLIAWRGGVVAEAGYLWWIVCAVAIVWSINLHNFMDGANGLLATQALFVLGVLTWFTHEQSFALGVLCGAATAACLAFLPYNVPRARLFLGDVGSGALGLLIAVLGLLAWREHALGLPALLILGSAFVADASITLLHRMLRKRQWYTRHREHLYQWLVRAGYSHVAVTGMYASWNLVVALPSALAVERVTDWTAWLIVAAVYALAVIAWVLGKRRMLREIRVGNFGRMAT
jgi:UDP-N-acetylmuramyl pentapeptide phosphotransferase/UDP-N-acetylglucosamine-1-phosphate transferase